jgi:hypothetical protein
MYFRMLTAKGAYQVLHSTQEVGRECVLHPYNGSLLPCPHVLQEISMDEVHALAVLGAGGFGQVLLVRYKNNHAALKCVAKAFVQVGPGEEHVGASCAAAGKAAQSSTAFVKYPHGCALGPSASFIIQPCTEGSCSTWRDGLPALPL